MKMEEIKKLDAQALVSKIDELKEELFNLRFQNSTGQLENVARIKEVRKDIARVNTEIRQRELQG